MRLIDADELNEYIGRESLDTREKIFALVDRMPTVEARPHGEWIEKSQFDRLCKNCGQQHIGVKRFANFCPNCGAQMAEKTCDNCLLSEGEQCDILVPSENCKYWKPKLKEGEVNGKE